MSRIPSKEEILEWISENPTQASKRDIARAFGIKGAARIDLKRLLKDCSSVFRQAFFITSQLLPSDQRSIVDSKRNPCAASTLTSIAKCLLSRLAFLQIEVPLTAQQNERSQDSDIKKRA